jgi:hypothetical protein
MPEISKSGYRNLEPALNRLFGGVERFGREDGRLRRSTGSRTGLRVQRAVDNAAGSGHGFRRQDRSERGL